MPPQTPNPAPLFPMFLKLAGRPCLVVGAGRVAEPKIQSLADCGAVVRVVAPEATSVIAELAVRGTIDWKRRRFDASDLEGIFLVVAGTGSGEVNAAIHVEAQRRGILCNAVDDPANCDFFYPAVVRRGHFQIAISTGGRSPALAQRVRKQLEEDFPAGYGDWVEQLGRTRSALFREVSESELRRGLIHESASAEAFARFERDQARTEPGKEIS